jgi:hypothetical protein
VKATATGVGILGLGLAFGGALGPLGGCSPSATAERPTPASPDDAGGEGDAADAGRVKGCPGEVPAAYAWQAPVAKEVAACAEADLTKLSAVISAGAPVTDRDIAAALGPTCAACAVGRVSDPRWRAVVAGHEGYIGNVGGCAVLLGANETCGSSIDRLSTCLIAGCDGCAGLKAQNTCADQLTAVDGPCAPALTVMRKQCPAATLVSAFDTNGVCQSFVQTIRLFCGPPAQDGG